MVEREVLHDFLEQFLCPAAIELPEGNLFLVNERFLKRAGKQDERVFTEDQFCEYQDRFREEFEREPIVVPIRVGEINQSFEITLFPAEIGSRFHELEDRVDRLKALNEVKNEFLGIAAHDLRSPLHRLGLIVEVIHNPKVAPLKKAEFLKAIGNTVTEMQLLLNDLLDVNRLERGKLELRIKEFDFDDFISQLVEIHSLSADRKQISVELFAPELVGKVKLDQEKVVQALNNLLSNAIKFSPLGTAVRVSVAKRDDRLRVEVQDQGPGISEAEQDKLFVPFHRGENKPTAGESSTGLGLVIAKKMVEAHQGTIGYSPADGGGSSFYIELPIEADA